MVDLGGPLNPVTGVLIEKRERGLTFRDTQRKQVQRLGCYSPEMGDAWKLQKLEEADRILP